MLSELPLCLRMRSRLCLQVCSAACCLARLQGIVYVQHSATVNTISYDCTDSHAPIIVMLYWTKDVSGLQAVNSLDGAVVDAVTLTKPPGWRPNQSARLHTLALFHANYTPTWLELSGINGPAEELILKPAEDLLFSEPELLDSLRNATLIQVRPCLLAEVSMSCWGARRASWLEPFAASSTAEKLIGRPAVVLPCSELIATLRNKVLAEVRQCRSP